MFIGIPKETKIGEDRVSLTPECVRILVDEGHVVGVEHGAGVGAEFYDEDYREAGAIMIKRGDAWNQDIVVKVKEPTREEYRHFRKDQIIFSYLHLAANRLLTEKLVAAKTTAIAFETIVLPDGRTPLLDPMSRIAGELAAQTAARHLQTVTRGKGILMSDARVMILGMGTVGTAAAYVAAGMGATVIGVDLPDRVEEIDWNVIAHLPNWTNPRQEHMMMHSNPSHLREEITRVDVVIGCVHVPGEPTARLITEDMVRSMKRGSVIVDVAIDQGGCSETSVPTTHYDPVYTRHGVIHYCVPNMPGIVPVTASRQLAQHIMPYLKRLAEDPADAMAFCLSTGVNVRDGEVVHPAVAKALDL